MQRQVTIIFAGQGTQWMGMSKSLQHTKIAQEMIQLLQRKKQEHWIEYLFSEQNDKAMELNLTQHAQPCIYIHNCILWNLLNDTLKLNWKYNAVLGHSLGEYNALYASNAVLIEDGLELVTQRGLLMQRMCSNSLQQMQGKEVPTYGMIVCMPCNEEQAQQIISSLATIAPISTEKNCLSIANINSSEQIVLSGHYQRIQQCREMIKNKFPKMKCIPLTVSAPFHCELMRPVAEKFETIVDSISLHPIQIPIISNATAQKIDNENELKNLIVEQIYKPVLWKQSIATSLAGEINDSHYVVEIGPKSILLPLIQRNYSSLLPSKNFISISQYEDLLKLMS